MVYDFLSLTASLVFKRQVTNGPVMSSQRNGPPTGARTGSGFLDTAAVPGIGGEAIKKAYFGFITFNLIPSYMTVDTVIGITPT